MAKRKAAAATEPEVETKVAKKSGNSATKKASPAAEKKPAQRTTKNEEAKTTKAAKASPSKVQPKSPKATQNGINNKSKTKAVASKSPSKKTAAASPKKAKTIKVAIKKTAKSSPKSAIAVKTKKPSPRSKVASPKQSKPVPKSAAPAKKKAASKTSKAPSKAKKAEIKTENEESEMEVEEEKPVASNSAAPRKRILKEKPEKKEIKAPKKPKIEVAKIHVPFRQVRGEGNVLAFGQGDVGQLGLGEDVLEKSRPALVAGVENVVDVHAGGMHTVCLTGKGEIYTFGCNDEGALGRDTSKEGSEFNAGLVQLPGKAVQISAGDSHTAAVLEDGRVFVWGSFRDSHGTMGLTSTGPEKLPVQILSDVPIAKVASGADHLVCLAHDGTVYTCGCAEQGQLGRVAGLFTNRGGRQGIRLLLTPQPVPFGRGKKKIIIDDIWTGSYCTFARAKETGLVYVFGLNNYNQLGVEENDVKFAPLLAESFIGRKWLSISCGQHHTLALDEEGKVYSLGRKDYGRLGLGPDTQDVAIPTLVTELKDHKIFDIAAGESVSFAVSENGDLFSWGMGTNGQLGHGNEDDLFVPAQVKGKQLEGKKVLAVSAGGQHTVVLAKKSEEPATTTTEKPEAKENGQ